jgi:histidinol-phosphate/aromatic aminotransferase/cobyric acid decarboxylase-like protein
MQVTERASYAAYPEPTAQQARASIAEWCGVGPGEIDVGPGAAEIIWTLVRTCVRATDRVLLWEPCFSEFTHAAHAVSATVMTHRSASDEHSVERRVELFGDAVRTHNPTVAYLCAPSSPRGEWLPNDLLQSLITSNQGTLFIIDQSYLNMSHHAAEGRLRFSPNAVLLRSLTKELGLPGIRVGYALMAANLRTQLQRQRPYWAVGAHAQAVLQCYVACQPLITERRQLMLRQARALVHELKMLGWQPELQDTPYFTVRAPHTSTWLAKEVATRLLQSHAIAVRDCASFGLPEHIRIVAHPDQARLLRALTVEGRQT